MLTIGQAAPHTLLPRHSTRYSDSYGNCDRNTNGNGYVYANASVNRDANPDSDTNSNPNPDTYTNGDPTPAPGLVAAYGFNEGSGMIVHGCVGQPEQRND